MQRESRDEKGHLRSGHVDILVSVPPKYSVAQMVGYLKGKSTISHRPEPVSGFVTSIFDNSRDPLERVLAKNLPQDCLVKFQSADFVALQFEGFIGGE